MYGIPIGTALCVLRLASYEKEYLIRWRIYILNAILSAILIPTPIPIPSTKPNPIQSNPIQSNPIQSNPISNDVKKKKEKKTTRTVREVGK
ncbi:predicted protein [Botrytis cinerea T4]|uniref:Uncharacterized protein n=1 Tax=Botryotinia fuckeliana (strain T4) TaxID=999810 RepID=G2Y0X9_BOTF4|nr:predicted protein [Botrytis cinerea T4]